MAKYLFNSDYPMPYLGYFNTGVQTVGGAEYYRVVSFAHNLPFTPLLIGQWSNNVYFNPSYDLAMSIPQFSGGQPLVAAVIGADGTNIWLDLTNNTGSDLSFHLRLAAFPPPDYNGQMTAVDDVSKFKFNSDYNYLKIYKQGAVTVQANTTATISHGLGYVPQTRIWSAQTLYLNGANRTIISPMATSRTSGNILGGNITSSALLLSAGGATSAIAFYYHIYADEA